LRLAAGLALAVGALLVLAGPALALTSGYKYSYSFGSQGSGNGQFGGDYGAGVAIDQSTGDVYVTDWDYHRVLKFDSSGTFLQAWGWGVADSAAHSEVCTAPSACHEGLSGTGPGQFRQPTGIAVDNSNSPNHGDVYVADGGTAYGPVDHGAILKFDSSGNFLARIDGSETFGGVFGDVPWNGAVSVDQNGFVWITAGRVMKLGNDADNEFVPGSEWSQSGIRSVVTNETGTRLLVGAQEEPDSPFLASPGGAKITGHLPCGGYFNGGTAFDMKTGNFMVANGGSVCVFTQKGEMVGEPFGSGVLGGTQGLAVNATSGDVYIEDSARVAVFVPRVVPDVTTGDATGVGHTGATLTGEVAPDPAGGGDVTECHFEIGTDTSYGTNVPCQQATPYSSSAAVSADVSGLSMETTYHYRLVATNSVDSNPGADRTFTPRAVIGLSTDEATEVTPDSVRLNGSFDPNSEDTHYYFEWGNDTSYGNTTAAPPGVDGGSTPGTKSVSADIGGLSSFTKYHYRIVAHNAVGTSYGEDRTVVTAAPEPPTIQETTATEVGDAGATLSTIVNPGFGQTTYGFEYGTTSVSEFELPASAQLGPDDTDHPFSVALSGLKPGTTYRYRVFATSFGGTSHSPELSFTTLATPTIGFDGVSEVTHTTAHLSAQLNPNRSSTTYRFEYGPTTDYGSSTRESTPIGADGISHGASAQLSGLKPGTTYHFRVVATNGVGKTADSDQVFTTTPTSAAQPETTTSCKKGFVKRRGHCVKKRRKHKRHHHRAGRTRRSHG
jgi:phosphodiesterase/alkaline phosphatase D-like protein